MEERKNKHNIRLVFKYISTIISWTIFTLLIIVGALLIYYFVSSRLYATRGEKYEPVFSVYTIVSGSMYPTISVYDVVINTKVNDEKDIKVNDVITFTSTSSNTAGMTITHRVIGIRELDDKSLCYVTRGDNNTTEDTSCVASKNVIGKVKAIIPGLGRIQFFLASKFGWLCVIVVPALYIIIKDVLKLLKGAKKNKEDYDYEEDDNINEIIKKNIDKTEMYPGTEVIKKEENKNDKEEEIRDFDFEDESDEKNEKVESKKIESKIFEDEEDEFDLPDLK